MTIPRSEFDLLRLRNALSSFATGVTIVTTCNDKGAPIGMTASSFNSVSMSPPLILWSVTKSAYSAPIFRFANYFAVHILSASQRDLSNKFARSGEDKFADIEYWVDKNNIPILAAPASRFDCRLWNVYEGGDHWIIIGEVLDFEWRDTDILVFAKGFYATLKPTFKPKKTYN